MNNDDNQRLCQGYPDFYKIFYCSNLKQSISKIKLADFVSAYTINIINRQPYG